MGEIIGIALLISYLLVFAAGALFGYSILFPVVEAARGKKASFRLYTADFFSLTLALTLPAMLVGIMRGRAASVQVLTIVTVAVFAISVWVWGRGATKLSAIGVTNSWKRFVFLGIVLPGVVLCSTIVAPGLIVLFVSTFTAENPAVAATWLLAAAVAAVIALIVGRKVCEWIVMPDSEEAGENVECQAPE